MIFHVALQVSPPFAKTMVIPAFIPFHSIVWTFVTFNSFVMATVFVTTMAMALPALTFNSNSMACLDFTQQHLGHGAQMTKYVKIPVSRESSSFSLMTS